MSDKKKNIQIVNRLHKLRVQFTSSTTSKNLETISESIIDLLAESDKSKINELVLLVISHELCAKYLVLLIENFNFPKMMLELLGLLFQKDMVPQIYISILSNFYAEYNTNGHEN